LHLAVKPDSQERNQLVGIDGFRYVI
jgi:hypothetical protein